VDVVVDSVGSTWADSINCLRPGGRLVVFGGTGGGKVEMMVRPVTLGQVSMLGTTMGSPRDFAGLLAAVEHQDWAPVIDSVRPLAEAAAAHAREEAGEQFGKLVLEP
jgi:NADPH:quinone reductase-like Zn-dependent oxidoreductase